MTEIGIYEAKTRFAELVKLVAGGESITITNRGKPVAELISPRDRSGEGLDSLILAIKANRTGKINRRLINELKLEGRRD
jgi:prevent-host-death family protein